MTTIKIALLGFGTVAQGTFNLLQDNAELIKNRTGVNVEISKNLCTKSRKNIVILHYQKQLNM